MNKSINADKIFSPEFILLCLSTLSVFCSFYLLLSTLPIYIVRIGGNESEIGLILGIFSFTSIILRPFVSIMADLRGKKIIIVLSMFILILSSVLYSFVHNTLILFLLRILHGIGWAGFTTIAFVMVSDIIPPKRRGEAVGYWGMSVNLAMAVGPASGIFLLGLTNFSMLFIITGSISLLGLIFLLPIKEKKHITNNLENTEKKASKIKFYEKSVLLPAILLLNFTLGYGAIISFLPLFALKQGINSGIFFTIYAILLILLRGFTGKLSDIYGREKVILPGLLSASIAMVILSFSNSLLLFIIVAVLYAAAFALIQPGCIAMAIDMSTQENRSLSMSTIAIAMDLGIGLGAIIWGIVLQLTNFNIMFMLAGLNTVIGFIYLYVRMNKKLR